MALLDISWSNIFKTKKLKEKRIWNSQKLMKIKLNFDHFKFQKKKCAKVFKKMVLYICYLFHFLTYT
jgi:hypothetical protein